MRRPMTTMLSLAAVGALVLLAGCSSDDSGSGSAGTAAPATASPAPSPSPSGGSGSGELKVNIANFAFQPNTLTATAGQQVKIELTNQDQVEHNITIKDAKVNQDVEAGEDASATFTAPAAGSYEFFCEYHPQRMRGTLTVQ
ncbi:MAG TPA: cupredoxin domain-containing protein [Actinomycetes bacterium]|nr:cupredoxin domain-containing protein [Actinomycetes bacterium]